MKTYLTTKNNNYYDFFEQAFDDLFKPVFTSKTQFMKTDIIETDKDYVMQVDLPGFNKDEINLNLENGYLTLSAEKKVTEETTNETVKFLRKERTTSSTRTYFFGDKINEENVTAKYVDGVLTVTVPKKTPELPKAKKICVE